MNIANIVRRFSFEEWGGTETVVWNTAKALVKKECMPEILCTRALASVTEEREYGVAIHRFRYFYPYFPLSRRNAFRLDKKGGNPYSFDLLRYLEMQDFNIIHCHTMGRLAEMARLVSIKRKIPYVISFHGGCYDVPEEELKQMMAPTRGSLNYGKFFDMYYGFKGDFVKDADGVICVGHNEYKLTKEKYPDKIVEYLPNGVEADKFHIRPEQDFRRKFNIPKERRVILCVSRIDYQKNQKQLVDFMRTMTNAGEDLHCILIGPVTADVYFREMRTLIREYQIRDRVTIIKGLPPDSRDLVAAYHAADMFILPSLHEPFGIVVLEAWAAGLPVIVSRVGGLQKLVTENVNGLFIEPSSTDSIIDAYHRLVKNSALARQLADNGYNTVLENYTWEKITDRLLDFYRRVMERHTNGK